MMLIIDYLRLRISFSERGAALNWALELELRLCKTICDRERISHDMFQIINKRTILTWNKLTHVSWTTTLQKKQHFLFLWNFVAAFKKKNYTYICKLNKNNKNNNNFKLK